MEHNEGRDSLRDVPTCTLPPPPRFDAAATATAQPVIPLPKTRILIGLYRKPNFSRSINRRVKWLALVAIIGLATGAAGGMLVVQQDKQQRLVESASMIQIPAEQLATPETTPSPTPDQNANLEVSQPIENQVPIRRRQRQPRKQPRELVVLSNADKEEEEEESDRDRDDDDKDKDNEDRKKDRERSRRDRERDADSRRSESARERSVLYDVMRNRRP